MISLGFHLSIAGSVANAPAEAATEGYSAFQIFTTSSRSWANSDIEEKDAQEFAKILKANSLKPYAHVPYLCNPSSSKSEVYNNSSKMLINNINNCNALGIGHLVIHLGSHLGSGTENGIDNACRLLAHAIDVTERVEILLENGAGYKNSVGSKFGEIGRIMDSVGSDRVGVCFDTCHAFAAGYDMRDDGAVERTMEEFDNSVKMSRIRLVHLNDAKFELGSGRDRHWHIGKGYIGRKGFVGVFRNRAFRSGSFIMELPEDNEGNHVQDMEAITSIIKEARK